MASKEETGTETSASEASDAMAARRQAGVEDVMGLGTAWAAMVSDLSAEMLGFLSDRIREDLKTQHRLFHCRDVHELREIQAEFLQKAIDQYQAETGKLIEMSSNAFSDIAKDKPGS